MAAVPLGFRPVKAAPDTTGQNQGNYTAAFTPDLIKVQHPYFELYHLYLTAPSLPGISTTADVLLNLGFWDTTLIGQRNSWDPAQPLLLTPGDTIFVFFNVPTSNATVPTVTAWFRYQS